jgi:hypothetical protein
MKKIILALVFVMALASLAFADTIVLRDGRTIRGTLLGFVNGRFVVRVENRYANNDQNIQRNRTNEGDIQYFRPDEIERIEIDGRSLDDGRSETTTVQVPLESNWIDSGINVRRNERVQITATGVIMVGRNRITPDGLRSTDPSAPLPNAPEGELIGAIGDDSRAPIIELGSSRELTADRDGRLYLTANRSSYADARGSFSVQIKHDRDTGGVDRRPGRIRSRTRGQNDDFGRRGNQDVTITVPGTSRGTDTGIEVRSGESITFSATGTVIAGRRIGEVGPEGARSTSGLGGIIGTRPVPTAGPGALIAYIRMSNGQMSQAYLIGSQLTTTVPADGRLILAINDDDYSDNGGSFTVRIRY